MDPPSALPLIKGLFAAAPLLIGLIATPEAFARRAPLPVLSRSVVVSVVSGGVSIQRRGTHRLVRLETTSEIPIGSTVDATHGKVKLVTATPQRGKTQFGLFDGGAFVVSQDRSGLATLRLVGGAPRSNACAARRGARTARRDARTAALSARVLRLLHGTAHGRFRTRGRYAAATVRGTVWTTTDGCEGTKIGDNSGLIATETNNAPLSFPLGAGERVTYRCGRQAPISSRYCIAVLTHSTTLLINGRRERAFFFSTGLTTESPDDKNDLCIAGPERTVCAAYPLAPPNHFGFRNSVVGCVPQQGPGTYVLTWKLRGVTLGAPLSFRSPIETPASQSCLTWLGKSDVGSNFGATLSSATKSAIRYSLPSAGLAWKIRIFLHPSATVGQQVLRGVVYADAGGVPGALLGTTDEFTYRSMDPPAWYDLPFPSLLSLTPGDYWIGVIADDQSGVAGVAYDTVPGVLDFNTNAYSAGASNPFGPAISGDQQLSMYLEYYAPPFAMGSRADRRPDAGAPPSGRLTRVGSGSP